jgi:hypothetical protein
MKFVDLNRHFVPLNKDQEPSLDIGRFCGARLSGWLNWEELRRRRRVILLAEAASGKTEEFRHQCDVLKAEGSPAFFLRIEELAAAVGSIAVRCVGIKAWEGDKVKRTAKKRRERPTKKNAAFERRSTQKRG